jgi:NitT/TauT family transport system substrate-binding protein
MAILTARNGALALSMLALLAAGDVAAQEKLRVGKSVSTSFAIASVNVGIEAGVWKALGIDVEAPSFRGDAQMQQAMASNSVDIGIGSGPGLGYVAKGVPVKGIAAMAGKPLSMCIIVSPNSNLKTIADLKGQKIGVTTAGSLTDWLVRELGRQQGWGPTGIEPLAMGTMRTRLAAMKTGQIAGSVQEVSNALELEEQGEAKIFTQLGDIVPHFHTHVLFARNELIEKNPELVRKFLVGWFQTVALMKRDKALTVRVISKQIEVSEAVASRTYDLMMGMLSDDGVFDDRAMDVLKRSYVELGILEKEPDPKTLYTDKFVPVKL